MIAKLRRRFILIMMSMVAFVLVITFSVLVISSAQQLKSDSYRNLDEGHRRISQKSGTALGNSPGMSTGEIRKPFEGPSPFSSFYATLDEAGSIIRIDDFSRGVESQDVQTAVETAIKQNAGQGTIADMALRYKTYESETGETVVGFIDISFEQTFIRDQVFSYTLIGIGTLAAFFLISLILSKLAVRPVDRAWKKQQQFVADASHELKTPITIMLANTSILQSGKELSKAESDKWLSHIDSEARHMKKLVEDLLFLARVDAKDIDIPLTRIDLSDTALQSALPFEPVMFESGRTLVTDIAPGLFINGNQHQIKQLISILLDNARKYAYPNTQVTLRLKKENNNAVMSVNNTADPIESKDIPFLFDRFYRADQARTRSSDSYGLGLSIAKEIVSMHKGKITVVSNISTGITFSIVFSLTN